MNEVIKAIELCKWAPSGGNTQPWHIAVEELTNKSLKIVLSLSKDCEKNDLLMEAHGYGALYSLGTLSHTIKMVLLCLGWENRKDEFVFSNSAYKCQSILSFINNRQRTHNLGEIEGILKNRRSNRSPYSTEEIDHKTKTELSSILRKYPELELISFENNKMKVAKAIGKLEDIRCQNERISKEFLQEVHFSLAQTGLPSHTIGQPAWVLTIIRLWKSISALKYIFMLGGKFLFRYLSVSRPIKYSGSLFALQAKTLDSEKIYQLGQCLCEIWFLLANKGYDAQIFGLPIFSLLASKHPDSNKILTEKEQLLISDANTKLRTFGINSDMPCLLFRSGRATQLASLSPRRNLSISLANDSANLTPPSFSLDSKLV